MYIVLNFDCKLTPIPLQNDEGQWIEDEEQTLRLKTNYIISAFGSGLNDNSGGWVYGL